MAAKRGAGGKGKGGAKGGPGRGRARVAMALLGFVVVASGVIWRRSHGIEQARRIRELDRERAQLEARKAKLQSDIRDAASRVKLGPVVERDLGMRVPSDSQVIYLPRGPRGSR